MLYFNTTVIQFEITYACWKSSHVGKNTEAEGLRYCPVHIVCGELRIVLRQFLQFEKFEATWACRSHRTWGQLLKLKDYTIDCGAGARTPAAMLALLHQEAQQVVASASEKLYEVGLDEAAALGELNRRCGTLATFLDTYMAPSRRHLPGTQPGALEVRHNQPGGRESSGRAVPLLHGSVMLIDVTQTGNKNEWWQKAFGRAFSTTLQQTTLEEANLTSWRPSEAMRTGGSCCTMLSRTTEHTSKRCFVILTIIRARLSNQLYLSVVMASA